MSIRDAGSRKAAGSYYTPTKVVRTLISDVTGDMGSRISEGGKRLFDPCCGTGNFLIQLPDDIELNNIYACDIDEGSIWHLGDCPEEDMSMWTKRSGQYMST